jgi:tryptophanyl-tRNA synthetase
MTETTATKRVLSGMRPTGRLHIGHYFGALQNWVKLQSDPAYQCFYFVADWHALTSDYADTSAIAQNSIEITIDFLASGLDPQESVIFMQSQVPEHAELHLLLSMITPLGWLERIPTYKEQIDNIANKDLRTYGFLGYPTLQTADIVMYSDPGKSLFVPVGEDQVSHVEFSRELVRKFNFHYGLKAEESFLRDESAMRRVSRLLEIQPWERENPEKYLSSIREVAFKVGIGNFHDKLSDHAKYFPYDPSLVEPEAMLTPTPRIPGLDGRKMSKSYGNAITLSETDADIRSKTKVMVTDPARKRRTDPGNPDICPVYDWHKLFSPKETLEWAAEGCRTAGIGCIECKSKMADHLITWIAPVRERRLNYEKNPKQVLEILDSGSTEAREFAQQTMQRVRESVFHWQAKRASL